MIPRVKREKKGIIEAVSKCPWCCETKTIYFKHCEGVIKKYCLNKWTDRGSQQRDGIYKPSNQIKILKLSSKIKVKLSQCKEKMGK